MHWKLFADLAEVAGTRETEIDGDPETVGEALEDLLATYPNLESRVLDGDDLRTDVNVLRNGQNVAPGEGLAAPVDADDELALFPPVSGG